MWKKITSSVYYYSNGIIDPHKKWDKIAMFDLDHTLIKPKSGLIHPKDVNDWRWCYPHVIKKLLSLIKDKYLIVIVSNQGGLKKQGEWLLTRIEIAMEEFVGEYDPNNLIPFKIYVPFEDDIYRKPNSKIFEEYIYNNLTEDYNEIFYVGDMDGAENRSDSDRKFAYNISMYLKYKNPDAETRVKFYNPDEFFEDKQTGDRVWQGFDPASFYKNTEKITLQMLKEKIIKELDDENDKFIMLVGPPASGKSTLAKILKTLLPNSNYVSRDECGAKQSCLKHCKQYLPKTVILDNTNASVEDRAYFINVAKTHEIPIYVFVMDHFHDNAKNKLLYKQLNIMRARLGKEKIPDLVYNIFYSKFEMPDLSEGITKIITMPFYPMFKPDQKFRFYQRYI